MRNLIKKILKESKDNLILKVRNEWIEKYGSVEDAEQDAMYGACDEFTSDVINLLNQYNIKFDLLNSITYTERIDGISGYHSLLKKQIGRAHV